MIALDHINLSVNAGEFVAIMGPSGCGNSTSLHLIGGLDKPSSGQVIFDGVPTAEISDNALTMLRRRNMGSIFQFFNLIPVLSAVENAASPVTLDGGKPAEARAKAVEWLTRFGLGERNNSRPDQLSGGSSNGSPSPAPLSPNPPLSWPTSRRAILIRVPAMKSRACRAASRKTTDAPSSWSRTTRASLPTPTESSS